jgi:hypothetical protein
VRGNHGKRYGRNSGRPQQFTAIHVFFSFHFEICASQEFCPVFQRDLHAAIPLGQDVPQSTGKSNAKMGGKPI